MGRFAEELGDEQPRATTGPGTLNAGTKLYVGPPPQAVSEPLLNCVREVSRGAVSISAAYAFIMAVGDDEPTLSIGLHFDFKPNPQELEQLFSRIGRHMRPLLPEKNFVDLLPLYPSNILAIAVRDTVEPFYRRRVQ
jgi:SseB protein C-terminal domain